MTPIDRLAHSVARSAIAMPGRTAGAARRLLPGRERALFVEATARAVTLGLLVVRDNRLYPGHVPPRPGHHGTAEQLKIALQA